MNVSRPIAVVVRVEVWQVLLSKIQHFDPTDDVSDVIYGNMIQIVAIVHDAVRGAQT